MAAFSCTLIATGLTRFLMLLRVAENFGFRIASLQHVLEGYKVADEIAAHGAGGSTFADSWGYKMEAFDAIPYKRDADGEPRRRCLDQLGCARRDDAPSLRRSGQSDEVWRCLRRRGVEDGGRSIRRNTCVSTAASASIEVGKDADLAILHRNIRFSADAQVSMDLRRRPDLL